MIDYILWFYYGPAIFACITSEIALLDFNSYLVGLIVLQVIETGIEIV